MEESKILLASVTDRFTKCQEQYAVTNTDFLDLRQGAMVKNLCHKLAQRTRDVQCVFYGGYEEAERGIMVFLPDYAAVEDYNPLGAIRVTTKEGSKILTHRDFLGSLTGAGIKREKIGDILVGVNTTDIIVVKEIIPFLLYDYDKAGRTPLSLEEISLDELYIPEARIREIKDTVASLRMDNVIAAAFSIPRSKAVTAIASGQVFVNHEEIRKPDKQAYKGDKLVLRGKGKAVLKEASQKTRKGKTIVIFQRWI
ncbi:MAG: YlmH/Sll1252 family protein [Anaerovoracaceae bacterium]